MKKIKLTKGYFALVDDEDFDYLSQYKWSLQRSKTKLYAKRFIRKAGKKTCISMHRCLLKVEASTIQVDHRDGNGLNNQKHNLRLATNKQNARNSKKPKGEFTSKLKGVGRSRKSKWRARITVNGRDIYLGTFHTEIDAGKAYDNAAKKYFREFAKLNFNKE